MKKIAVPSDDGTLIAAHFGRCAFFLVFETEDGRAVRKEVRANGQGGGEPGQCHGAEGHDHAHGHNHATMRTPCTTARRFCAAGWAGARRTRSRPAALNP